MPVTKISSMDDFNSLLERSKDKLVVIDFTATWCGPCQYIGPIFVKMSDDHEDVEFAKCDVDEVEDVAAQCGIRAMPTFQFYRNGEKIHEVMGADPAKLTAAIVEKKK